MTQTDEFDDFVRANASRMLRTAFLLCGDHQEAEDLVQSTYAKVFSNWRRVVDAESPVAYARTILTRTFLSTRRRKRFVEQLFHEVHESSADDRDVPLRVALLDAVAHLSVADRAVLVLRYWEDLSVAETSETLGISESACRTRTSRALTKLRSRFPDLEV